jgi:hypothetical protein
MKTKRMPMTEPGRDRWTAWCASCGGEVHLISAPAVAAPTRLAALALARRVAADELHFTCLPDGSTFVCLDPLTPNERRTRLLPARGNLIPA